jgi:PTS system mannose-specific IIB component/fructoselysine and glucoselysine-specific PTS system IIB component
MPIVLFRVDERLIHGQVVVGWGHSLHPERIVVVDDELADSAWERELYVLGLPPGIDAQFDRVEDARAHLAAWREGRDRILLLTRDVTTMARLAQGGGLRGEEVNLGGIHFAPGRRAVLPYLYLNDTELQDVLRIAESGVHVTARDLPQARRVELDELIGRSGDRLA